MSGRLLRVRALPVLVLAVTGSVAACSSGTTDPTAPGDVPAVGPQFTQILDIVPQEEPVAVTLLRASQVSQTGSNVVVGIIDDGFYTGHPDLVINNCVPTSYQPDPCSGGWHGNIAAGVIKATNNAEGIVGVAPSVTLKVCRAADNATQRAACINALSSVDILSISWGHQGFSSQADSVVLHDAIKDAYYNHSVLILAEANNRMNGTGARSPMYPASWPEVVGVSGVMPNGVFADLSFHDTTYYDQYCPPPGTYQNDLNPSEWGDASNYGSLVELAGPFYTISTRKPTTEYPGLYRHVCGTSFATPAVAGVAALVMQANGLLSRDSVRAILQSTADRSAGGASNGQDPYYGYGLVDAVAAVAAATAPPPPPPPPPVQVTLSGPATAVEHAEEQCVWEAVTSGGQGTKTYEWYYDYQRVYPNPWVGDNYWYGDTGSEGEHNLLVVVRDDTGADSDEMNVTVDNQWAECGW